MCHRIEYVLVEIVKTMPSSGDNHDWLGLLLTHLVLLIQAIFIFVLTVNRTSNCFPSDQKDHMRFLVQ